MIQGYNLKLSPVEIDWREYKLARNSEVKEMIKEIQSYFKQENTIYDACLVMTNNEYENVRGEYGGYRRRIDYEFNLRYLVKVVLYGKHIEFHIANDKDISIVSVEIKRKFFYFIEWESNYYK